MPNAGFEGKAHPVQDMTLELFQQTYMLNVFSVMLLMKYAAPTLIEKKSGAVVVVASAAAYTWTAKYGFTDSRVCFKNPRSAFSASLPSFLR